MTNITLYIPDLFGPDLFEPDLLGPDDALAADMPDLPALSSLLSKASCEVVPVQSSYHTAYQLMGFAARPGQDVPVAVVTRRIDQGVDRGADRSGDPAAASSEDTWLRADPVHLHVGREGVVMLDTSAVELTRQEARALADELCESFASRGWALEVPVPNRWYLRLPEPVDIHTVAPEKAAGGGMLQHLPEGRQAPDWHRLLNDIQMRLHQSEVNQRREQRGELSINSLWLWGSGAEPAGVPARWDRVYSADVFVQGLADLSRTPCHALPASIEELDLPAYPQENVLICLDGIWRRGQQQGGYAMLLDYEQRWFSPLLKYARRARRAEVVIHGGTRIFYLNPMRLMFFWNRTRPFAWFANLPRTSCR